MTIYSLSLTNESTVIRSMLVFQKMPDLTVPDVVPLAWLAKPAAPGTTVTFSWSLDFCFVWSESGSLAAGAGFKAAQVVKADPTGTDGLPNKITFDRQNNAFLFTNASSKGTSGTLSIGTTDQIAASSASIGIGMSGAGTFVVPAIPRDNVMFTPHPEYWVAFGDFQAGQVLDITMISNDQQIDFGPNIYSRSAVYGPDGNWTVA